MDATVSLVWLSWASKRSCRMKQLWIIRIPTLGLALRIHKAFPLLSPSLFLLKERVSTFPKCDTSKVVSWEAKAYFLLAISSCYHMEDRLFIGPTSPFLNRGAYTNIRNNNFCCQWSLKSNVKRYLQLKKYACYLFSFSHLKLRHIHSEPAKTTINSSLMSSVLKIFSTYPSILFNNNVPPSFVTALNI